MKTLCSIVLIMLLAMPALANKPMITDNTDTQRVECTVMAWTWNWDGSFTTEACDTDGAPVWEYGVSGLDPNVDCDGNVVTDVLGTVLNAEYPIQAGERAILGSLTVDDSNYLLEICHYYDTENSFDGGNVDIGVAGVWTVIEPVGGYPDDELCDSDSYYAWCVDGQPGFTDGPVGYVRDCFDMTQYLGQTVEIGVKFGSDSSVTYPGWYISQVRAGGMVVTPTEESSWSTVKSLF